MSKPCSKNTGVTMAKTKNKFDITESDRKACFALSEFLNMTPESLFELILYEYVDGLNLDTLAFKASVNHKNHKNQEENIEVLRSWHKTISAKYEYQQAKAIRKFSTDPGNWGPINNDL